MNVAPDHHLSLLTIIDIHRPIRCYIVVGESAVVALHNQRLYPALHLLWSDARAEIAAAEALTIIAMILHLSSLRLQLP